MMGYNIPTPQGSCLNMNRDITFYSSSQDQQRAKYTKVENTSSNKAVLGQTLREVQARLSSFLRMLEEVFLVFLELEISEEKEVATACVESVKTIF